MSTVEDIGARLAQYLAAEAAILKSQEYTVGQGSTARRLVRADLAEVRRAISDLQAQLATAVAGQQRTRRMIYLRPH